MKTAESMPLLSTQSPSCERIVETLFETGRSSESLLRVPRPIPSSWGCGFTTHKGFVRSENEDCVLCFRIGDCEVAIVADGCGGMPAGQHASYAACLGAASSLMLSYGEGPRWAVPGPRTAAVKAIQDALYLLGIEGRKYGIQVVKDGMRTTLVVVVVCRDEVGWANAGDGGGCILRSSGAVHHFLEPHKASGNPSLLATSLGPVLHGTPASGRIVRQPGDLLFVGSDGVFDRVDGQQFPKNVLRACILHSGNLQHVSERVVRELAEKQDEAGFIFDDNMTLVLLGDGTKPRLGPGFWKEQV